MIIEGERELLTEAIAQLLQKPEFRKQLGENAGKLVRERYSWGAIAQELAKAYQAIIQKRQTIRGG
jgi:glycosyltransferase involved in cell wall biosynthesis